MRWLVAHGGTTRVAVRERRRGHKGRVATHSRAEALLSRRLVRCVGVGWCVRARRLGLCDPAVIVKDAMPPSTATQHPPASSRTAEVIHTVATRPEGSRTAEVIHTVATQPEGGCLSRGAHARRGAPRDRMSAVGFRPGVSSRGRRRSPGRRPGIPPPSRAPPRTRTGARCAAGAAPGPPARPRRWPPTARRCPDTRPAARRTGVALKIK